MDGMAMTPNNGDRPRTIWTASMNHYFMDLVLDQVRRGNMIDHAFRKQVWAHMTVLFNEKFGFQYDKDVLKNRYKSLRKKYNEITTLLKQSGFHWDGTRQMVIADDTVWDNYIKAHPDARSYRTKILPNYGDLCMIYGSAPPDGKYSHSGHQEALEDDSSRTKSGEVSEEGPVAQRDDADDDDAQDSSDSGQDMTQRRTDEEITNGICEVENTDHSLATTSKEGENNLFPVDVVFALEASPPILNNADGYRSRVSWTPPMDRYFIDLMLDHVRQGNKIGRTFSKDAWMHMIALFSEKFGSQYDKDVLYNRFKTLRKQYVTIRTLLDHDGFDWDEALQMVRADVQVWDEYIKAHPEARQYRVRPMPHFNDLCTIYGGSTVLGKISYSDHVSLKDDIHGFKTGGMLRTPVMHRDQTNDVQEESSYLSGDMDTPNKRLFVTPSVSEHSKKPRWTTDESMVDALREMANAVALLAEKKKENDESVSIENVIDALQALPDLDEDLFLDACDLLEDEKKAKTFLVLDVRLRKKWLMRKLRPS